MRSTVAPRFTYTQVFFPWSLSPKPAPSESVITVVFVTLTTWELRLFGWSGVTIFSWMLHQRIICKHDK